MSGDARWGESARRHLAEHTRKARSFGWSAFCLSGVLTVHNSFRPIIDAAGQKGVVALPKQDTTTLEVRLDSGEPRSILRSLVTEGADGTLIYRIAFDAATQRGEPRAPGQGGHVVASVVEEQVDISKRVVELENVRLRTSVTTRDELVDLPLYREEITVERIPVGRVVEAAAPPRQEGDTMVVPVYEEVLVVEKRLVLREEIRITRVRSEQHDPRHVALRREDVHVERTRTQKE